MFSQSRGFMITNITQLNNETYKFQFAKTISDHEATYSSDQKKFPSALAQKLFGFPWTQSLKVGTDYIELTKQSWVDWDILLEPLQGLLTEHVSSSAIETQLKLNIPEELPQTPEVQQILTFIQNSINPSLAAHGGWVELKNFKDNTASIFMGGGCQGCGMSAMTLKEGIETNLKAEFSFVHKVIDVTDHTAGSNPYFQN